MRPPELVRINPKLYLGEVSDVLDHRLTDPLYFSEIFQSVIRKSQLRPIDVPNILEFPGDMIYVFSQLLSRNGFVSAEVAVPWQRFDFAIAAVDKFSPKKFEQGLIRGFKTDQVGLSLAQAITHADSRLLYFPGYQNKADD